MSKIFDSFRNFLGTQQKKDDGTGKEKTDEEKTNIRKRMMKIGSQAYDAKGDIQNLEVRNNDKPFYVASAQLIPGIERVMFEYLEEQTPYLMRFDISKLLFAILTADIKKNSQGKMEDGQNTNIDFLYLHNNRAGKSTTEFQMLAFDVIRLLREQIAAGLNLSDADLVVAFDSYLDKSETSIVDSREQANIHENDAAKFLKQQLEQVIETEKTK